jgi:dTDP-4-dehydrorhamnose 3,5-epimerase
MGKSMTIRRTGISGVTVVESSSFNDARGAFLRCFCKEELAAVLDGREIVQINHSRTNRVGAVRGMHFQYPPRAEMKLVRCIRGRVLDVALDLRRSSPTFLRWHAEELFPESGRMLVVPEGCAHGFQVLQEESELLYLHTEFYSPESEGGVHPEDPAAAIRWPLSVADLSERDRNHPLIQSDYAGAMP